ncbi:hypothetical protein ACFL0U_03355, partial [Pseudomonadota bacterium]
TGSYMVQYMGSEVSITIRSLKTSWLEKFMPKFVPTLAKISSKAEKTPVNVVKKTEKAVDSSDEEIAVAIAVAKSKIN